MPTETKSISPQKKVIDAEKKSFEDALSIRTLLSILEDRPDLWEIRKAAAMILFDNSRFEEAADLVWNHKAVPVTELEIAFAARVLSKGAPRRSIRLLKHAIANNVNAPVKLIAIANALMHYGMVMQAARFYGAATACDETLDNGDWEHHLLWLDDSQRLWGDWAKDSQSLNKRPRVKPDQDDAKAMSDAPHPIKAASLNGSTSESLMSGYYSQFSEADTETSDSDVVRNPLASLDRANRQINTAESTTKKTPELQPKFERQSVAAFMATATPLQKVSIQVKIDPQSSSCRTAPVMVTYMASDNNSQKNERLLKLA